MKPELANNQMNMTRRMLTLYSAPLNFRWKTTYSPMEIVGYTSFPVKDSSPQVFYRNERKNGSVYAISHTPSTICENSLPPARTPRFPLERRRAYSIINRSKEGTKIFNNFSKRIVSLIQYCLVARYTRG